MRFEKGNQSVIVQGWAYGMRLGETAWVVRDRRKLLDVPGNARRLRKEET
jgi:hypothetical protein